MSTIESIPLIPAQGIPLTRHAAIDGMDAYLALVAEAAHDHEAFWARLAREHLNWRRSFTRIFNDENAPFYRWFEDGELNASYNCLDRNLINGNANKTAIIFESDDGRVSSVTYQALYHRVCRLANALRARGVKKGDRVVIYLPMSVEGVVAMRACARIGTPHSVVFGGFSAKSFHERMVNVGSVAVITADEQVRAGKTLPLKTIRRSQWVAPTPSRLSPFIGPRADGFRGSWAVMPGCMSLRMTSRKPASLNGLASSIHCLCCIICRDSLACRKGVQHSTGGYLTWAAVTMRWTFGIKPEDIFWYTANIGWITGHMYICYGPTAVGATQVIFEGVPTYPNAGRFWDMIQRHKVDLLHRADRHPVADQER